MQRLLCSLCFLSLLAPAPTGVFAKERPAKRAKRGSARRYRLDFDKADVRDVAKFISEITGKNIILSDKARGGKITIFSPTRVTREEAYRAFLSALEANNLTVIGSGKFLKIVPQRDAKEMPGAVYDVH
jgi:general secretion pathway protein D